MFGEAEPSDTRAMEVRMRVRVKAFIENAELLRLRIPNEHFPGDSPPLKGAGNAGKHQLIHQPKENARK